MSRTMNNSSKKLNGKRLKINPEYFPVYGDQEFLVEVDLKSKTTPELSQSIQQINLSKYHLNLYNYIGVVYSKDSSRKLNLYIKDVSLCKNKIVLSGIVPANKYPESCVLLVFKSLIVNKKITNSTDFSKNEIYEKLQNEELNLSILGYTKLTYFKDNYFRLCEYLFNSVYDSSALESENFEFKSYIFDKNDFKLQNFDESITSCPNLYLKVVDERLVKSFDCISLPPDWTHLGHISLIEKVKYQPRENLFHFCSRYNFYNFCSKLIELPGSSEAINSLNRHGQLPCFIALKYGFNKIAELMFQQSPNEIGVKKEIANSDNIDFYSDSSLENASFTSHNLKSSKPKQIEKISQQSNYQKPRNLKEKSQKNKMNQSNNANISIKHNGQTPVRVNSKETKCTVEQPEFNASKNAIAHKSASLKNNTTLKQTFLNNSVLPSYGHNHPHLSNYPKHHTIVDIKNFSANLSSSIEENSNLNKESCSYEINELTNSLDTLCSSMEITSNLPVIKDNFKTNDNRKPEKIKTKNKRANGERCQEKLNSFACFTDINSIDKEDNKQQQNINCPKNKSILKHISKFVEDGSSKRMEPSPVISCAEPIMSKRNSITFSLSAFLFPLPSPTNTSTIQKPSNSKTSSMLARFKQRNLSTSSNNETTQSVDLSNQNFNSSENLSGSSTSLITDKKQLKNKAISLCRTALKSEAYKNSASSLTIENTNNSQGSKNKMVTTGDISVPFPIRKSVSYKLINNLTCGEEDDIEIKRFSIESSQESDDEESDLHTKYKIHNETNFELSDEDEVDLEEDISKSHNSKNNLNTSSSSSNNSCGGYNNINGNKKSARFDKCKLRPGKSDQSDSSIIIFNNTSSHSSSGICIQNNQDISIIPGSVSTTGSALLPPLPRTFLTQSVSLAPLTFHSLNNKKQPQLTSSSSTTQNISTCASALNLSHDFDRNIKYRRSSRFIRQPGTIAIQDTDSILNSSDMMTTNNISSVSANERFMNQKLNTHKNKFLKKAVSTPSIVDKIKSEECDNVFYEPNENCEYIDDYNNLNFLREGDVQIKIINETSSDKQEYNLEAGKSDSDFQSNSIIPVKKIYSKRTESLNNTNCISNSSARSLLKSAVSLSILGSASVVDLDNETDQSLERRSNSPNSANKLVTINEFLKEIEMTQNTKKVEPVSTSSMSDLAASVATSQNTRLNSQLSCSTSANLNTINNQVSSGSVNSLNTIFSPNKKSLIPSTRINLHNSFNTTSVSPVSFQLSPQKALKPYEKSLLKQSTPLIKQSSFDSILTTSTATKSISKSRKLGQILKLASVRGAKTKSLKQKYISQIQQHSFTSMQSSISSKCCVCQQTIMNKKILHCKNCALTVHDSAACREKVITCLNGKPSNNSQSPLPNNLFSSSMKQAKSKTEYRQENLWSQSLKQTQFSTNPRPKSMDITKLFQAHISKSTSNMCSKSITEEQENRESNKTLRDSVDFLNYKFEDGCTFQPTTGNLFRINLDDLNKEFLRFDSEFNVNNWADLQTEEFLQTLNKQARNKQENTFEFMKTEANFFKILMVTQKIYLNVMQKDCKIEQKYLQQMFPDLDRLINLHRELLEELMRKYQESENKFVKSIGNILLDVFSNKSETIIDIYSKICCTHLTAKSLYKQFSISNKPFIHFLQECRKHPMLRRYQIPDCLTIITQRLTKYLTLIENMISNSKEDINEFELLESVLSKLRHILTRVNDAVAFHQNTTDYKKILEQIDPKSYTFVLNKTEKQVEQKKFTKNDLINKLDRKMISVNQVSVKFMSNNGKIYKDITCLTLNDIIVFLHLNDKSKYVFMNENSVIPCTNGILIRPKFDEILTNRLSQSTTNLPSAIQHNSANLNTHGSFNSSDKPISSGHLGNSSASSNSSSQCNISNSSYNLSYIVNTITNEIVEIKFPDEQARNQWATLVHTHITPFIQTSPISSNSATDESGSMSTLRHQSSNASNISAYSNSGSSTKTASTHVGSINAPPLTANTYRCNSNISTSSSNSSGHGSSVSTSTSYSSSFMSANKLTVNGLESALKDLSDNANSNMNSESDMNISPDIANILYSFNNLIEQNIFQSNLIRSASSAGETVTRNTQDPHVSMPKRAETFNGASSSKESQVTTLNLNANILQSYLHKTNNISESDSGEGSSKTVSKTSSNASDTLAVRPIVNTDLSTDFGYHSRLSVDMHQDIDGDICSCSVFDGNHSVNNNNKIKNSKSLNGRKSIPEENKLMSLTKGQFESILRTILSDYMRIKSENEQLRKEIEISNSSLEKIKSSLGSRSGLEIAQNKEMQAENGINSSFKTNEMKWITNTIKF